MVQNRRQDGLAVNVNGSDFKIVCSEAIGSTQTDEEKPYIDWHEEGGCVLPQLHYYF